MKKKKRSSKKRRRIFLVKTCCAVIAFLLVLAMSVVLVMYRNGAFDGGGSSSEGEEINSDIPETPDVSLPETEPQPEYPPSEPTYEPLYGEEYSTFRLPRNTEEYQFVETLMEIAFGEPAEAEDANGVTKYGTYFGNPTYEWCTEFALWCVIQAQEKLGVEYTDVRYPYSDWSGGCVAWYKERGLFFGRDSDYVPRRGDMIFFDYDYDGSTDHTGLVCGVEYDLTEDKIYILTIEGNLPEDYPVGSIKQRRLACDWKKIYGYGTFLFME